jgi:hypothetical protein
MFSGKIFYILSPQSWSHIKVSKHNYALELAKNNTVYFVAPPLFGKRLTYSRTSINKNLVVVDYVIPSTRWLPFKFPVLYKWLLRFCLERILKKNHFPPGDYCIDFGCYQQFDSIRFFPSDYKIFFPVDDFEFLKPEMRGCDIVFTVSKNIQQKYPAGTCHFINHGLTETFAAMALQSLEHNQWRKEGKIRVGYAGNLFLKFIDTHTLKSIISQNRDIDFHLFGSHVHNQDLAWQRDWNIFLTQSINVTLHGTLDTAQLAQEYLTMDVFILCYQPDYKNYHGENSHKVLEYLSTGKTLVTTYLSIYDTSELMVMSPKDKNDELPLLFSEVISRLESYNIASLMKARKIFALANTYGMQLKKMAAIIHESLTEKDRIL